MVLIWWYSTFNRMFSGGLGVCEESEIQGAVELLFGCWVLPLGLVFWAVPVRPRYLYTVDRELISAAGH